MLNLNSTKNNKVQSLDDDLDLFNESDWNFLDVSDNFSNVEYFNDIRDTQFDKGADKEELKRFALVSTYIAILVICIMFLIERTGVFNKSDYDRVANIHGVQTLNQSQLQRVDGEKATDDDMIEISQVLNNYFQVLAQGKGYSNLYDYCSATSTFADTYEARISAVKTAYDVNDCSARMLKILGSLCKSGKINDVIVKDGVYYTYVNLTLPTDTDTSDFVYACSYNLTKHFNSNNVSEESISKYLLDVMETNKYSCSTFEYCLKFKKADNGTMLLTDDSTISNACTTAYSDIINQTQQTVGGNIKNMDN